MSAPAAAFPVGTVHVAAAAASSSGQPRNASTAAAAGSSASTPTVEMTQLYSYVNEFQFECHPTLPLVLIGGRESDGMVSLLNWQTRTMVGEVDLEFISRECRWLGPTADHPTVDRFVAVLNDGETDQAIFVCTVHDIHLAAAAAGGWKIDSRRVPVSSESSDQVAINSTNTLLCTYSRHGFALIDLQSGEEVLKFSGDFPRAQFAADNPYTLLAYKYKNGCLQYDLRSSACKEGRVSTRRPPKEWLISSADLKSHLLFPQFDPKEGDVIRRAFSPDGRFFAFRQSKGPSIVRSMADGRVVFEAPPPPKKWVIGGFVFTSDSAHLLDWSFDGCIRLMSTVDGSLRWSIQLPNWKKDEMWLMDVRPCPGQPDRLLCVILHSKASTSSDESDEEPPTSIKYRLFDVRVVMPAVVQPPIRPSAPPVTAAAAAAASGPSSSTGVAVGRPISVVSSSAPSSSSTAAPTVLTSSPPASSLVQLDSGSMSAGAAAASSVSSSRLHQLQLRLEQTATRAALDQLDITKQIIAEMEKEKAATMAIASPAAAAAAPLRPGEIVVKREHLLDLHETAAVARRQKRKAEDETKEEREQRLQQATSHREQMEQQLAERKRLIEARAVEQKKLTEQIRQLDDKLENERRKTTCCACLIDAVEVVYSPCGHAACCSACDDLLHAQADRTDVRAQCPICRQTIRRRVAVTSLQHTEDHQQEEQKEAEDEPDEDHPSAMPPLGR